MRNKSSALPSFQALILDNFFKDSDKKQCSYKVGEAKSIDCYIKLEVGPIFTDSSAWI